MNTSQVVALVLYFALIAIIMLLFVRLLRRRRQRWGQKTNPPCDQLVAEGIYDHAEYTRSNTVIHFNDGRTCVMWNHHDITFPRGTSIKIFSNGEWNYKIEKA